MERRTVGPLVAMLALLVVAAGLIGVVSLATLGGAGGGAGAGGDAGGGTGPRRPSSAVGVAVPPSGALIRQAHGSEVSVVAGGARIPFHSLADLAAGYGAAPTVLTVPESAYEALPTRVADETLVKAAGNPTIAEVRGGRRYVFHTWASLVAEYGPEPPFVVVPAYYFDGLPIAGS